MKTIIWYIDKFEQNDKGVSVPAYPIKQEVTEGFKDLVMKHNHYPPGSYIADDEFNKYFEPEPAKEAGVAPVDQIVVAESEGLKVGRPPKGDPEISSRNTKAEISDYLLNIGVHELALDGLTKKELLELYDKNY